MRQLGGTGWDNRHGSAARRAGPPRGRLPPPGARTRALAASAVVPSMVALTCGTQIRAASCRFLAHNKHSSGRHADPKCPALRGRANQPAACPLTWTAAAVSMRMGAVTQEPFAATHDSPGWPSAAPSHLHTRRRPGGVRRGVHDACRRTACMLRRLRSLDAGRRRPAGSRRQKRCRRQTAGSRQPAARWRQESWQAAGGHHSLHHGERDAVGGQLRGKLAHAHPQLCIGVGLGGAACGARGGGGRRQDVAHTAAQQGKTCAASCAMHGGHRCEGWQRGSTHPGP